MAINLNLPTMMGTPYTTEADKLISDIRSFQAPNIPTPPPTIPKLTGFGDKLARIGGFGDEPGELKTKEELEKMTQAEIDAYVRQRKQARRLGASEALIQFGEALQGKPAAQNALAREQARKNIELQNQYQKDYENAIRIAEQTNPQQARLLRSLGLPGYINLQQKRAEQMLLGGGERKIKEDYKGIPRYVDTGERVFPGVEILEDKTDMTETERMQAAYNKLMNIPVEGRSAEDNRNIAVYERQLFGQPRVISFFDSEGNVVPEESITSIDLSLNPNILKEKADLGLSTVGQSPSITPKGAKSVMTLVRDDYLGAKSQIDTINDLASIIEQNKDAFTLAGGLANFVNSAKYQVQSAERLGNLAKLQQNEKEFTELNNLLDSKYGDILDKISQDRAVAKSIFLRLAYGTAKEIDPSGRLSDNDVKIAMDIIGNLGPNWKANLATLESLANRTQREYADKYKVRIGRVGDEDLQEANKYETIPQFLGGRDWRQSMPTVGTQTSSNIEALILKYGD